MEFESYLLGLATIPTIIGALKLFQYLKPTIDELRKLKAEKK